MTAGLAQVALSEGQIERAVELVLGLLDALVAVHFQSMGFTVVSSRASEALEECNRVLHALVHLPLPAHSREHIARSLTAWRHLDRGPRDLLRRNLFGDRRVIGPQPWAGVALMRVADAFFERCPVLNESYPTCAAGWRAVGREGRTARDASRSLEPLWKFRAARSEYGLKNHVAHSLTAAVETRVDTRVILTAMETFAKVTAAAEGRCPEEHGATDAQAAITRDGELFRVGSSTHLRFTCPLQLSR